MSICRGEECLYYRHHENTWRMNRETGEFVQIPNAWHCHSPQALKEYRPNRKTGGVPIGRVCWSCKGLWFEPRSTN